MSHLGRSGMLLDPPNTLVSIFHSSVLTWCKSQDTYVRTALLWFVHNWVS